MADRETVKRRIGRNIKRVQGAASNIAIAHNMKLSPSQISEWRNGGILPEITALLDLAAQFKCALDDLVRGVNPEYDAASANRRAIDLDHDEAALIAAWDTIRQENASEAQGYLSHMRTRVETMLASGQVNPVADAKKRRKG